MLHVVYPAFGQHQSLAPSEAARKAKKAKKAKATTGKTCSVDRATMGSTRQWCVHNDFMYVLIYVYDRIVYVYKYVYIYTYI